MTSANEGERKDKIVITGVDDIIPTLMDFKGITEEELADKIGKPLSWVQEKIRNPSEMDLSDLSLITHSLGVGIKFDFVEKDDNTSDQDTYFLGA